MGNVAAIVHIVELLGPRCVDLGRIIALGGNCDVEVMSVYDYAHKSGYDYAHTHKSIIL